MRVIVTLCTPCLQRVRVRALGDRDLPALPRVGLRTLPVSALQARVLDVMAIGPNVRGRVPVRCYTSFSGRPLPALARACATMICLQCNMTINVRVRVTRTRGTSRRSPWRHVLLALFWCTVPHFGA